MRELKLSSPLNIQIITESERMALRIALDKSIGENLGMVLALKDTKREIPQGLYNSGSHVRQKRDARHGIETRGRVSGKSRSHVEQKYYQRQWQELAICPDCGIRTNADYWYCPWCGAAFPKPEQGDENI